MDQKVPGSLSQRPSALARPAPGWALGGAQVRVGRRHQASGPCGQGTLGGRGLARPADGLAAPRAPQLPCRRGLDVKQNYKEGLRVVEGPTYPGGS